MPRSQASVCRPAFALYAAMCRRYPPERVEASAGSRAQLEETARLIWGARPVAYYAWSGHEQHANVTQTARAMSLLYALTGCFDAPGGNVLFPGVPHAAPVTGEELASARRMAPAWASPNARSDRRSSGNVTTQRFLPGILDGKPYPVRALIGFGSNMLLALADGGHGRQALAALDFFAHADLFMTPTAALADVVLPVASASSGRR